MVCNLFRIQSSQSFCLNKPSFIWQHCSPGVPKVTYQPRGTSSTVYQRVRAAGLRTPSFLKVDNGGASAFQDMLWTAKSVPGTFSGFSDFL